jgi:DNA/RNA-binding domain of Phe-tRNA-synthetase-like protein
MEVMWDPRVRREIEPFALGLGLIKDIQVSDKPKGLEFIKKEVFESIRENFTIVGIKETPVVKAYRKFYWKYLNIDPTKTRPSGEALARRVLKKQKIPIISNIVFAINLASIRTQLSFSGFDLNAIEGDLVIRYAKSNEEFQGIGTRHRILTGKELLLADEMKILCIYAYGDADATRITEETRDILLVDYGAPQISRKLLEKGIKIGLNYIQATAGGVIGEVTTKSVHPVP